MTHTDKLKISLFGRFAVSQPDGSPLTCAGKKNQALLAYLAANCGVPQSRAALADLLWGDRFEDQARQSLRQAILRVRKDLGKDWGEALRSDGEDVALSSDHVAVDVDLFERFVAEGTGKSLEQAVKLYNGPFLEGFNLREAGFEEWCQGERTRYGERLAEALSNLCNLQEAGGGTSAAIASAKRLIELDPTRESGHRTLMRLLAAAGQRAQALKQYRICAEYLTKELGVEPDTNTQQLHEEIRASEAILPMTKKAPVEIAGSPEISPSVPEGPSIAVLPFVNLSDDSGQVYFSDGITDDLITALSQVRTFLVIARQSSFAFKGKNVSVKDIGRKLGVRYILEGSVRKAGDRIRVTAQLVEAATDAHIWAERYDGTLEDIFDLQDEIAHSVVGAIEPELQRVEFERIKQKRPDRFDAYDLTLLGLARMNRLTAKDNEAALQYFVSAIETDPGYARAYVCASYCYRRQVQLEGFTLPKSVFEEAIRLARKGLRLDPSDPYILWQSALTFALVGNDFDEALMLVKRSLMINSSSNRAWIASGMVHCYVGEPETAIAHAEKAMRLSPLDISMWVACWVMATGYMQLGDYAASAEWARKSIRRHPDHLAAKYLLASGLAHTGKLSEAQSIIAEILETDPDMTIERYKNSHRVSRYKNLEGYVEGLAKAGLPL